MFARDREHFACSRERFCRLGGGIGPPPAFPNLFLDVVTCVWGPVSGCGCVFARPAPLSVARILLRSEAGRYLPPLVVSRETSVAGVPTGSPNESKSNTPLVDGGGCTCAARLRVQTVGRGRVGLLVPPPSPTGHPERMIVTMTYLETYHPALVIEMLELADLL